MQTDRNLAFRYSCAKNGAYIAFRQDNQVSIHSPTSGERLFSFWGRYENTKFTETGNSIVLGAETLLGYKSKIVSLKTRRVISTLRRKIYRPSVFLQNPSNNELTLFWGSESVVRIDNLTARTARNFTPFPGHKLSLLDVTYHGDLIAVAAGKSMLCYELSVGMSPGPRIDLDDAIKQLALSPTGAHVGVVLSNGLVGLFGTGYPRPV